MPSPAVRIARRSAVLVFSLVLSSTAAPPAMAQITAPRTLSSGDPIASLEEQLINRLHASSDSQRVFLRRISNLVRQQKLDQRLVVAVYHYALQRNPHLPFPFFERAIRFEASKRGVALPPVALVAHSASAIRDARR